MPDVVTHHASCRCGLPRGLSLYLQVSGNSADLGWAIGACSKRKSAAFCPLRQSYLTRVFAVEEGELGAPPANLNVIETVVEYDRRCAG